MKHFFFSIALILLISPFGFAQTKTKKPSAKPVATQGAPPEQAPSPVIAEPGKDVVAIYPFTTSRDYSYDYALSVGTAVEAGFVRSARFTVVERNRFGAMSEEDHFKEANTAEIVKKAARFGAKTIVTGHVVAVSHGDVTDYNGRSSGQKYAEISLSFKIIDVESGVIKMSEIIRGKGTDPTSAGAAQNAYLSIDRLVRIKVAEFMPQRFKFMSVAKTEIKKKVEVLTYFKFWGGSDNGIKVGDAVEVYTLNYIVNPNTNKKVEEKNNIGIATITEVNSGSTATCEVYRPNKYGAAMFEAISKMPDQVVIEYTGGTKPKGFWDL